MNELENVKSEEMVNGDYVVWDILEGAEHLVYLESFGGVITELYTGSNYDFAEKEYEVAVKYFKGEGDD